MIKKIKLLTIIFLKDYYQKLNIIKNNKIDKKAILTWLMIIFTCALSYLSLHAIEYVQKLGQPILFLKVYLPIIATIMIIQLITLICRIFYYSKDLEYVMPLPIKTTEILISKLNTVIFIMYFFEIIYLLIPLLMYGISIAQSITFFIAIVITLLVFPVLFAIVISFIMLFVMKLSKLIKNQDLFQSIIVSVLTFIVVFTEINYIEKIIFKQEYDSFEQIRLIERKIDEINESFIVINPIIKILESKSFGEIIFNLSKIIFICSIFLIIFIFVGKKLYIKNIIQNRIVETNKIKRKNKYKLKNKEIEYIKKDIKKIIKTPTQFMQNIFQYVCLVIVCVILLNIFLPIYISEMKETNFVESMKIDDFRLQATLIVVGILQMIFTFSNLSITAISREGKNAKFMKYIPISLYKQFKLKAVPQIFLNIFVILMILTTIYLKVNEITIGYYIITFIISMILNVLNSYIMILIDLKNPNLNWGNEESIAKNNTNKLYQYVNTILICLILNYFANIFAGINFAISITCIILILVVGIMLLKKYIKNNINKIFNKIY